MLCSLHWVGLAWWLPHVAGCSSLQGLLLSADGPSAKQTGFLRVLATRGASSSRCHRHQPLLPRGTGSRPSLELPDKLWNATPTDWDARLSFNAFLLGEHDETAFRRRFGSSRLNVRMCRIFGTWVSGPRTRRASLPTDHAMGGHAVDWILSYLPTFGR